MTLEQISLEVLGLPTKHRAILAEKILQSLDDETESDIEKLWQDEAEMIMATQFYEAKSETVAARFVDEIEHALRVIATAPQRSPFFSRSVRRYLLRRFPYGLLYQVYEDHV